jgi:hypothetical protein
MRSLAVAALMLLACKAKKSTDDLPLDEVTVQDLERERAMRQAGKTIGEPLRAPKIVIDATEARVGSRRVAARGNLEPLNAYLVGLREHWKALHPDEDYDPLVDLTVPRDMSFVDGIGVFKAILHAGYPSFVVHDGDVTLQIELRTPGPPPSYPESLDEADLSSEAVLWDTTSAGTWTVAIVADYFRYGDHIWQPSECARTKQVDEASIASVLATDCRTCVSLVIGGAKGLHEALAMVDRVRPAMSPFPRWHRPRVAFTTEPCGTKWTW